VLYWISLGLVVLELFLVSVGSRVLLFFFLPLSLFRLRECLVSVAVGYYLFDDLGVAVRHNKS
jgi:hypothetical protein